MAAPQQGGALSYIPEPQERPYFDGLFQTADTQRSGNIGGQQAVAFFSRSKLPIEQLKTVWTVADNPPTNSLDKRKFAVALRLIQLLQNGVKGQGANLAVPPGVNLKPAFFEGVSGVSVPMPNSNPQQQQQQQPGGSPQGGPQPTPPQQQQQRPPPQQQQQQQPPPQQQQQQQMPPQGGGGRPPIPPNQAQQSPMRSATPSSMALAVQDPYTLTPAERGRYEAIFPEYAKEDGFMHGKEAVELFSKSGLDHALLRDIWNMADQPVDNKLDKLEFAIAMHLIVCISKKNLPMPKVLPISLKQLKQQQQQQQQQQPPGIQASASWGSQPPPSTSPQLQPQQAGMPPPQMQQQMQQPPHQQMQMQQQPPQETPNRMNTPTSESVMSGGGMAGSSMQGPPPIASAGGMDISDAFEGLNTNDNYSSSMQQQPSTNGFGSSFGNANAHEQQSYGGGASATNEQPSYGMGMGMGGPGSVASQGDQYSAAKEPEPEAVSIASPPRMQESTYAQQAQNQYASSTASEVQKTTENLAKSYNMDDAHGELGKLKSVLQKLQAENISLKAQLGTMSEEEKDVQKQINATVHEIAELSNQLTGLRAQVLAARTTLLEKTAELKASQEKKGTMKDLIGEAEATKQAMEEAYQGLEDSIHGALAPTPAPQPAPTYEADLFGFGHAPMPAPAPAQESNPHSEPSQQHNYGAPSSYHEPAPMPAPAPAPVPIPYSNQRQVETVSEDETSTAGGEDFDENPEDSEHHQQDWAQQQQQHHDPYGQAQGMGMGSIPQNNAPYGSGLESHFRANAPPGHNKQSSISSQLSFDRDGIMGGAPIPASQFAPPPSAHEEQYDDRALQNAPSMDEIENLKKRAKEAADIANDAESSLRQLTAKADKLRTAADQAEMEARQKVSQATEKKGGFMGGGKKKKSMKEAEKAKQDAEEKKKKFLAAQSQANDAQAVAMETKREAEKLRKEAEQVEMEAAEAASLQHKQPAPAPAPQPTHNGGYPNQQQAYQQQQKQQYHQGYDHNQQPQQLNPGYDQNQGYGGGFGGQPLGGGYNPNVMVGGSGGGIEIPSPAQGNDPYNNPFG